MRNIIPMELTDLNSSIDMAVRPTYGGLPKYGVASGAIASFITNINYPLKKLEADITAVQSGSGDPSPTNVRPISGWDDVNVNVSGINQWDEQWELGVYSFTTGAKSDNANYIRNVSPISVLANTTYNWRKPADKDCAILYYDASLNFIGCIFLVTGANRLFITPENCAFVNFYIQGTTYDNNISINYPSTETDYHAYNGNTYTTDLDGTRYGGSLDVTTGVLTIIHEFVDLGTLNWNSASNNRFYATVVTPSSEAFLSPQPTLCDCYKAVLSGWGALQMYELNYGENITGGGACVGIRDDRYANATDFKSAMSGHQLVYPLKNPKTVQLTEQEVESVCGQNNILANSGQVYVEYHFVEDFEE